MDRWPRGRPGRAAVALTPFPVRGAGATGDGLLLLLAAGGTILVPGAPWRLAERPVGREEGWATLAGTGLVAWVDGAAVPTDELAPVDQLLTPYRTVAAAGGSR